MNWYALKLALLEALLILTISAPVAWFFHGWALAVVDAVTPDE